MEKGPAPAAKGEPSYNSTVASDASDDTSQFYIIQPQGAHAAEDYERLREGLAAQVADGVERHSIPGRVAGSAGLRSGRAAEIVAPVLRGMYSWTTAALVDAGVDLREATP